MSYPPFSFDHADRIVSQYEQDSDVHRKNTPLINRSFSNASQLNVYLHHTPDIPISTLSAQWQPPAKRSHWRRICQTLIPESIPCRLYILVIVVQTVIDLTIEGILVLKFNQAAKVNLSLTESSDRRLPVYFTIFGFAHIFQLILAFDAVWMRNTLQFLFLAFFNLIILTYAVVQIFEIHDAAFQPLLANADTILDIPINVLTVVIPCVIATAEVLYGILGYSIWLEFGWKVYKLLGADRRIKRMHVHYQIFLCFTKFDVFFWGGFSIQLIWMVLQPTNVEYYVTVAALPASLVVLIAGHLGARHENRPLMYAFMISCGGACGYFAFKLFRIIQQRDVENIKPVFKTLVAFAVLAIVFLMATFTWACIVLNNFGGGLKIHMSKRREQPHLRSGQRESQLGRNTFVPAAGAFKRLSLE